MLLTRIDLAATLIGEHHLILALEHQYVVAFCGSFNINAVNPGPLGPLFVSDAHKLHFAFATAKIFSLSY